ncbi:hypothetical protein GCM10008025_08450 [Ornithinibacillus halotolerans]|uniref:Uncharacterized protein n=1 Tax=Ornithinibacillus halotolerans TaxID=1274357 RepID=A0A916RQW6_9BACI|nr:hypothetical protein GCM10008025_08450 [Ornithinibacillus halotolerans]
MATWCRIIIIVNDLGIVIVDDLYAIYESEGPEVVDIGFYVVEKACLRACFFLFLRELDLFWQISTIIL